jgi:NADH-quinone oxidoreductase subunit G
MIDTRDDVVVRLRPRANLDLNRHFMCDAGRADYRWMNRGDRVEAPLVRSGQLLAATDWDTALRRLAATVQGASGRMVLLASGRASLESLAWVRRLCDGKNVTAAVKVPIGSEAPLAGVPNLALRKERVPNLDGALLAGYTATWDHAVGQLEGAGLAVLLDVELDDREMARLGAAACVVAFQSVDDDRLKGATLLLPVSTMAEENGTYVNRDGRVQRFTEAKAPPGMARPAWWVAAEAWALGDPARSAPGTAALAFARLGEWLPALSGMSHEAIGFTGQALEQRIPAVAR